MTYRHDAAHLTHIIHRFTSLTSPTSPHHSHCTSHISHHPHHTSLTDHSECTSHIRQRSHLTSHLTTSLTLHITFHHITHISHLTSLLLHITSHHSTHISHHSHITSHYKNCATKNFLDQTPVRELPRQMHMEEVEEPASTKSTMHNTLKTMPDQRKVGEFYDKGTANRKLRELPRKSHSQPIQKRRRTPKSTKINTNNAHRRSWRPERHENCHAKPVHAHRGHPKSMRLTTRNAHRSTKTWELPRSLSGTSDLNPGLFSLTVRTPSVKHIVWGIKIFWRCAKIGTLPPSKHTR